MYNYTVLNYNTTVSDAMEIWLVSILYILVKPLPIKTMFKSINSSRRHHIISRVVLIFQLLNIDCLTLSFCSNAYKNNSGHISAKLNTVWSSGVLLKMKVGIRKRALQRV